jgi:hypothetical protein
LVRYDPAPGAGKPFKEAFRNHGPYSIVGRTGDFFHLQTITGFAKFMDIHTSRIQPFRWDQKSIRNPIEVASDAERTSIVISIVSWAMIVVPNENLPRNKLRFEVEFTDGIWTNITYDMIKDVDVLRDWVAADARAPVREIIRKRASRPNQRYARKIKKVAGLAPPVTVSWIAKPQDSFMSEPDGIGLDDIDFKSKQLLVNKLNDVIIFSDDPRRIQQCKDDIMEYIDIFTVNNYYIYIIITIFFMN